MHRATGKSILGRRLVSMKRYDRSGGVVTGSAVKPKAGWKFVNLLGRNGHSTVAKIRSHHHILLISDTKTDKLYEVVQRPNYLE